MKDRSHCREPNEIPFGRNSTPKGSWSRRQTFQAHERSVSETFVSLSPFPSSFSTTVLSTSVPVLVLHTWPPYFTFPAESVCTAEGRETIRQPHFGHATPIDTGDSLSCNRAVVSRKWTPRHYVILDNSRLEPFRWNTVPLI